MGLEPFDWSCLIYIGECFEIVGVRQNAFTYVWTHTYTHTYTYLHTQTHTYQHTNVHKHSHTHAHIPTPMCYTQTYTHTSGRGSLLKAKSVVPCRIA